MHRIVSWIDFQASELYLKLEKSYVASLRQTKNPGTWRVRDRVNPETATRFACYAVADRGSVELRGSLLKLIRVLARNSAVGFIKDWIPFQFVKAMHEFDFVEQPLLHSINPKRYFPNIPFDAETGSRSDPAIDTEPAEMQGHCKVGYVLMAYHKPERIVRLLHRIHRPGKTIVMLHLDGKFPNLKHDVQKLMDRSRPWRYHGIYFYRNPFAVHWGHSSMVMAQQAAFFALMDRGPCDFYINLSEADYPLHYPDDIISILEQNPRMSWLNSWTKTRDIGRRINGPPILDSSGDRFLDAGYLVSPKWTVDSSYPNMYDDRYCMRFPKYSGAELVPDKVDQWMVLSNEAVQKLRTDRIAILMLAFFEFVAIPDEIYYGTVVPYLIPDKILRRPSTFTKWNSILRMEPYDMSSEKHVDMIRSKVDESGALFARKFEVQDGLTSLDNFWDRHVIERLFREERAKHETEPQVMGIVFQPDQLTMQDRLYEYDYFPYWRSKWRQ
jgi:hypothetical protein